jgi:hypothetical protein
MRTKDATVVMRHSLVTWFSPRLRPAQYLSALFTVLEMEWLSTFVNTTCWHVDCLSIILLAHPKPSPAP